MNVVAKFDGDFSSLSNFHPSTVHLDILGDRMVFPSGEHAFQAAKAWAVPDEKKAREFAFDLTKKISPSKAKLAGRKVKIDTGIWDSIKDDKMRQVVFSKYLVNPDLRKILLSTHTKMLVEGNDWNDEYWGRCEGKGLNRLGAILMEVRGYWFYSTKTEPPATDLQARILMGW